MPADRRLTTSPLGTRGIDRFIPADPEPAPSWATEELRKALVEWFQHAGKPTPMSSRQYRALMDALEHAPGLLPRAPASTTDRAASIDGEWFV